MTQTTMKTPLGVIDMGSNGIRFGIVNTLARHLPVAYEERAPISLLDSQGDDQVIPAETIEQVITSFLRFKEICRQADVEPGNVQVIATEATRVAANAEEFIRRIDEATGWKVSLLSKEEEALISASGIVGSFYKVNGLTMDLGGGSVELSYVTDTNSTTKEMQVCPSPISMPYGAAALKRRLARCNKTQKADLYDTVVHQMKKAIQQVNPPSDLMESDGYRLFMSGGGFRALGYLSMAMKAQKTKIPGKHYDRRLTYPISIINGYSMSGTELSELAEYYKNRDPEELVGRLKVFRISKRRASMIPASCFLVSAIMKVIKISRIYFSEGGVRQGFCYQCLSPEEQAKDPLLEGIKAYAASSPHCLSPEGHEAIYQILKKALPYPYMDPSHPLQLHRLLPAVIHLSNMTSHFPKESRAFVAFHMPLANGPLANLPGVSHEERAILSLLLAYRQGGAVPDPVFYTIQAMVGRKGIAVCKFIGRLMELVFTISPMEPGVELYSQIGLTFTTSSVEEDFSVSDSEDSDFEEPKVESGIDRFYPPVHLRIELPAEMSPMVEAPAVMSVIESLNKKIKARKFDMDDEVRPQHFQLFSVQIVDNKQDYLNQ
ncbi:Ppx/GppA phosphatase family-domain-containing protein [Spinellus fusiger]|nr:Ppx/GppA phosphatase family-domain-containing protein [Spinellus fusiger]